MKFIRIGTDVRNAKDAGPFVERAKKHGMLVCANFMKSYTMEPAKFAEKAKLAQEFGSDILYIVDSAGGMLSSDIEQYCGAVRDVCDIALGFHGHNNLGLAVANSLRAVELGVSVIDTSLQGMGRSAGNTPTEIFVLALERMGICAGVDPLEIMDVGEKYIRPLIQQRGFDSVDMISGYAQFHSSYMGIIREFSEQYQIDPRLLIMELCAEDKEDAPREKVDRIARRISEKSSEVFTARFRLDRYHGREQSFQHEPDRPRS